MKVARFRWAAWSHFQWQVIEAIVTDPYWAEEDPRFLDTLW